jgi:hypothetical protein
MVIGKPVEADGSNLSRESALHLSIEYCGV